jgi:hypothetical protein
MAASIGLSVAPSTSSFLRIARSFSAGGGHGLGHSVVEAQVQEPLGDRGPVEQVEERRRVGAEHRQEPAQRGADVASLEQEDLPEEAALRL